MRRLFITWICFSMLLFLIILLQNIFRKYGDESYRAWLWFISFFLPGLIIILFGYFRNKKLSILVFNGIDAILYNIILGLSITYLLSLTLVMLLQPFSKAENTEAENLHETDTGLYIFQVIVLAALGVLTYTTQKRLNQMKEEEKNDINSVEPGVFISYNHADKLITNQLKQMLEKENIPVTIDSDAMLAGEDIKKFIEQSIFKNRTTISIISNKSLLSGWVGMETINTFFLQRFLKNRQFIACYIDKDFFDLGFTASAAESFDKQLEEINTQIEKHNKLGIDSRDLNDYKTRIISLRGGIDEIVQRLKGSLCVEIGNGKLKDSFPLILKSISAD